MRRPSCWLWHYAHNSTPGPVILNFAYGSNLCRGRLRHRVPTARYEYTAALPQHVLRFHKRSVDGSGKATLVYTGSDEDVVWGAVISLSAEGKAALDKAEGLGSGYTEREVQVVGLGGRQERVWVYVASPQYVDESLRPYVWYLDLVVDGATARSIPQEYVDALANTPAMVDPDRERAIRQRASC